MSIHFKSIHFTSAAAAIALLLLPATALAGAGLGVDGSCGNLRMLGESRPDCLGYNPYYAAPGSSGSIGLPGVTGSIKRPGLNVDSKRQERHRN